MRQLTFVQTFYQVFLMPKKTEISKRRDQSNFSKNMWIEPSLFSSIGKYHTLNIEVAGWNDAWKKTKGGGGVIRSMISMDLEIQVNSCVIQSLILKFFIKIMCYWFYDLQILFKITPYWRFKYGFHFILDLNIIEYMFYL